MLGHYFRIGLMCYVAIVFANGQTGEAINKDGKLNDIQIECNTHNIKMTVLTGDSDFNGMIYPKGLAKNSSCLTEYEHAGSKITYVLPLRACGTMNHDVSENLVEYSNTVIIEPHSKLVTSLGRAFHVRCRYESNDTARSTVVSNFDGSKALSHTKENDPLLTCSMKIFKGRSGENVVAESAKIGEFLTLVIALEDQENYGMKVTNCVVNDGLSWSEQPLINNEGCPIDEEVMSGFEYNKNLTKASIVFHAHKFPFTASLYYQCVVKLCTKKNGGCDDVPPVCDKTGQNVLPRRRKRQSEVEENGSLNDLRHSDEDARDKSLSVFTGILVNEVDELEEDDIESPSSLPSQSEEDFCLSTRKFAIGIALAGILLMFAVIFLVACIVYRRRRRKGTSTTGSSIYSGPYSNHAYSRD